jgi:CBS domain-containing protein
LWDIIGGRQTAVDVATTTSVADAAKLLAGKGFRSVPVWDEEEGRYIAFIDEIDLMEYAIVVAHPLLRGEEMTTRKLKDKFSQFTAEEVQRLSFGHGTVADILRLPGGDRRRIHVFESQALLYNAMQVIKDFERVLVRYSDTSISRTMFGLFNFGSSLYKKIVYKICTQTDILRFVVDHLGEIHSEDIVDSQVRDCGRFLPVVSISVNDRAIDGFLKIIESRINACAVLDQEGRIVATLSASDLRGLTHHKLKYILLPVMQFLPAMTGKRAEMPLTCRVGDNLLQTMKRIVRASTRRCWVVDDYYRPIGYLSMGTVINYIITKPCKHF